MYLDAHSLHAALPYTRYSHSYLTYHTIPHHTTPYHTLHHTPYYTTPPPTPHHHIGATPFKSLGPTGQVGSEGNYGLVMVGSANIQNCNVSSTCCDGYNATIGLSSCGNYPSVCAVLPSRMLAYDLVLGEVTRRGKLCIM